MSKILMKNVGSAQHILLWPEKGKNSVVVDYGIGTDYPNGAAIPQCANFPWLSDKLIFTHYHEDHYNGFIQNISHTKPKYNFSMVYYPKMPHLLGTNSVDPQLVNILIYLISAGISKQLVSSQYHSLYDLFNALLNNNAKALCFIPVAEGDTIQSGGYNIDILWPRKASNGMNRRIYEVIDDIYTDAQRQIPLLRKLHAFVNTTLRTATNSFQTEFVLDTNFIEQNQHALVDIQTAGLSYRQFQLLNLVTKKTTDILNKWSIAFKTNDDILCLGDLNATQINNICSDLINRHHQTHFDILMAAHHGTHKGFMLKKLFVANVIASVGNKLVHTKTFVNASQIYKKISKKYSNTLSQGDIQI